MKSKNSKRNIFIFLIVVLIFAFLILNSAGRNKPAEEKLDAFAKCLTEREITMYGADWCPHCLNEKKAFGKSFRLVKYVECPNEPQKCIDAGINGYPTWIFSDGRKLEGEQGLEKLSRESGCELTR